MSLDLTRIRPDRHTGSCISIKHTLLCLAVSPFAHPFVLRVIKMEAKPLKIGRSASSLDAVVGHAGDMTDCKVDTIAQVSLSLCLILLSLPVAFIFLLLFVLTWRFSYAILLSFFIGTIVLLCSILYLTFVSSRVVSLFH